MNRDFQIFEQIKNILQENNKEIRAGTSWLTTVYRGLCNHLYYYMDAYKLLFENDNYYVCKTIERAILDLYVKTRCLVIAENIEMLAQELVKTGKIDKQYLKPDVIKNCSTTYLCEYFDEQDGNVFSEDVNTGQKSGVLTTKYRDACKFVHPAFPCIWSYTTDSRNNWQTIIQNDRDEFIGLVLKENSLLSILSGKIIENQRGVSDE
ncbi:MAG: hypothetical protein NC311_02955 [Muribaculaceae bacterium]|nr:hypothetical protein [Muribaculaceae bacterium]